MLRRTVALVLVVAFVALSMPSLGVAAPRVGKAAVQGTGKIDGTAQDSKKKELAGVTVQLRNVDTGALVGSTTSAANGAFSFSGLSIGNYVIEIVDAAGKIIGVSTSMAITATVATISGVTIAASAAGAVAAAAAAGGAAAFFTSTGGILVLAAAGTAIGVTAYEVTKGNASPSR
jgi:hypothetical protein